jgi:flagellar protein FlaI
MGLFDKNKRKSSMFDKPSSPKSNSSEFKSSDESPFNTSSKQINRPSNSSLSSSLSKKMRNTEGDGELLDSYDVIIDDIPFEVQIRKKEGITYYLISDIPILEEAWKKFSSDLLADIKAGLSGRVFETVKEVREYLSTFCEQNGINVKKHELETLAKYYYLSIGKLGLMEIPLNDGNLEELMVNGTTAPTYVAHRKYDACETNIHLDNNELMRVVEGIAMLANRTIDSRTPMLDAFLPDGSRVNATTPDVTLNGVTLTIRKFSEDPLTIIDLIKFGTFNVELAAFLWQAVEGYFGSKPANTLIAGGTGSGKTTTLNVVSLFSMYTDRIITVEDTPELQIPHKHVVKMITRPARPGVEGYEITMDDLIKNTLRMRPDRIFVGEVRGPEARSLLTAMNTGHDGALVDDEPIYLSNGHIINIGEFVDKFFEKYNSVKVKENNGFEWIDISDEDIFIKSFNKDTLKIEDKLVSRVWRKKYSGKMIKIKTKSGKEIILTNDHPMYVLNNRIYEINAEMVKTNDYIALPRELKTKGCVNVENPYLIGALLGDGHLSKYCIDFVNQDYNVIERVSDEISNYGDVVCLNYNTYTRVKVYGAKSVNKLSEYIPIGNKTKSFNIPIDIQISDDNCLAEFIRGLFDSDGHVNETTNRIEFATSNKNLANILPYLLLRFGIISHKSEQKMDGKGNVGPHYKITIGGYDNIWKYWKHIGFTHSIKNKKLNNILSKSKNSIDVIPNIGNLIKYYRLNKKYTQEKLANKLGLNTRSSIRAYEIGQRNPSRMRLNEIAEILNAKNLKILANSDIYWDKVVSVEEIRYDGYIYDLTVEDNHTYIAGKYGGFIISNCSGTLHANSADEAISRLINPPMSVPKIMITALDFIINQQRIKRNRKTIRRILSIMEIGGSGENITKTELYKYNGEDDTIHKTGICMWEEEVCKIAGIDRTELMEDRKNREEVIKYMIKNNINGIKNVGKMIRKYQENPEETMRMIR